MSSTKTHPRNCNWCQHVLYVSGKRDFITCGKLLAEIAADTEEGEEIDTELADGIAADFAEECEDFESDL